MWIATACFFWHLLRRTGLPNIETCTFYILEPRLSSCALKAFLTTFLWYPVMDLARAPRRAPLTARKKGSGYENGALHANLVPRACDPREGTRGSGIILCRKPGILAKIELRIPFQRPIRLLPETDYPRASRSFPRIAGSGNEIVSMREEEPSIKTWVRGWTFYIWTF
jgi:hypothetical protein